MNELKQFKEKKLAEWNEKFNIGNNNQGIIFEDNDGINRAIPLSTIKQFISDLIDEMLKAIPKMQIPPDCDNLQTATDVMEVERFRIFVDGFNKCRDEVIKNLNS